jgi:hypothetical protein
MTQQLISNFKLANWYRPTPFSLKLSNNQSFKNTHSLKKLYKWARELENFKIAGTNEINSYTEL